MFDRYMIVEDGFENVTENGTVTGFKLGARLPYYRGLGLSMVEAVVVTVDGVEMPRDAIRLTVHGNTYTLDAMETEYDDRWEFGEVATVTVLKTGGLSAGAHKLELSERLRISYMPVPSNTRDAKTLVLS